MMLYLCYALFMLKALLIIMEGPPQYVLITYY